jgi:probable rRNA maturation factor
VILNHQDRVAVNLGTLQAYLGRIQAALRIRSKKINVCLVSDGAMRRLNRRFRGKPSATDVLSFPWERPKERRGGILGGEREFQDFLGDVAISAETAARNAHLEGHEVEQEVRWLILHGTLHLLGYDHETDEGEMTALELQLRDRLEAGGSGRARKGRRRAKTR